MTLGFQLSYVEGMSMAHTLEDGDHLLLDRFSVRLSALQHGDIIVFTSYRQPGERFVKRVIALPGESVEIRQGRVFVNDVAVLDEFSSATDHSTFSRQAVPAGCAFVLGDNRANSEDSRVWGAIPMDQIEGVARFRFWPFSRLGFVNEEPSEG